MLSNQMARDAVTIAFEIDHAITVYSSLYNPIVGIRGAMPSIQATLLFLLKDLSHCLLFVLRMFALSHITNGLLSQIAIELIDSGE